MEGVRDEMHAEVQAWQGAGQQKLDAALAASGLPQGAQALVRRLVEGRLDALETG